MKVRACEGLVLRVLPFGEADKLVTWYGAQTGRITAIAKGAQKSKKRFVNKLEPFSRLRFFCRPPRRSPSGLYFLEEAELLTAHLRIRQEYPRFLAATGLSELCLRFTRDLDPDPRLYTLLLWAVEAVSNRVHPLRYLLFFHLKLLQLAGYRPDLVHCRRCGEALSGPASLAPGPLDADAALLVCGQCLPKPSTLLSLQALRMAAHAQDSSLDSLHALQAPRRCLVEMLDLLHRHSQRLLQADLHAWPVLRGFLCLPAERKKQRKELRVEC